MRRRFIFDITSQLTAGTQVMTNATTLKEDNKGSRIQEWISWTSFKEVEGYDVAMSMIQNKKVQFELHEGLDKDTKIPFPENQQFRRIRALTIDDTVIGKEKTLAEQAEGEGGREQRVRLGEVRQDIPEAPAVADRDAEASRIEGVYRKLGD